MKKLAPFLLVFVAPFCVFFSSYLGGRDFISRGTGFLVSAIAMFLLPFLVSALIAALSAKSLTQRILAFIAPLVVQFVLIFAFVPPGASSEMMGIGHRFRNQFQIAEVRSCAASLLLKYQDGTLVTNLPATNAFPYTPLTEESILIADSELPADLRGKFRRVGITTTYDRVQIVFEVEPQEGIMFGECSDPEGFFHYELGEHLYAYRYQRP
jgi:hypothetical protein